MAEKEIVPSRLQDEIAEFHRFFPSGELSKITYEELPPQVIQFFEGRSKMFILPEDYKPEDFLGFARINHNNGDVTYIASQEKLHKDHDMEGLKGVRERLLYILDTTDGVPTGRAEVRSYPQYQPHKHGSSDFFIDKPFLDYSLAMTDTTDEEEERRILEAGGLALAALERPLHSCHVVNMKNIATRELAAWERLAEQGRAVLVKDGEEQRERYCLQLQRTN